jgi:ATP-dependent RNA helicase DHX29
MINIKATIYPRKGKAFYYQLQRGTRSSLIFKMFPSSKRSMARVNERVINYDLIEDILTVLMINTEKNEIIVPPKDESTSESIDLSTGSILIFFPGIGEISCMNERLKGSRHFGNDNHFEVIPLHSSLSPKDQKRAFKRPQAGRQKIILATNIAETSVTIPDCVCGEFMLKTSILRNIENSIYLFEC